MPGRKRVTLALWNEIGGVYNGICISEEDLVVTIGKRDVVFPVESAEAETLREVFKDRPLGKKYGLLRTDSPERPIRIRLVSEN